MDGVKVSVPWKDYNTWNLFVQTQLSAQLRWMEVSECLHGKFIVPTDSSYALQHYSFSSSD